MTSSSIVFLPDSGAEIDAIPSPTFKKFFDGTRLQRASSPETATGTKIRSDGTFQAKLTWNANAADLQSTIHTTIHVLQDLQQPVLSTRSMKALGMLHSGFPHIRVNEIKINTANFPRLLSREMPCSGVALIITAATNKERDLEKRMSDFKIIFDGECRPMNGPPCRFELVERATPVAMRGSRPVAEPLKPRLKIELDSLEQQGTIQKVIAPTALVHPIVCVPKKDGGLRLCVDFRTLNKCIIRPRFETATQFQAVRSIPTGMKYFTAVDTLKGYYQVPLDEESIDLTTFFTPFGRFHYRLLPFGVTHAGDDYSRRVSDIFDDLPNSRRIIQNMLVFSENYEEHLELVRTLFERAAEHGVSLNKKKLVFAVPSIKFGGYIVDEKGYGPDPELTRAIR